MTGQFNKAKGHESDKMLTNFTKSNKILRSRKSVNKQLFGAVVTHCYAKSVKMHVSNTDVTRIVNFGVNWISAVQPYNFLTGSLRSPIQIKHKLFEFTPRVMSV